MSLNIYHRGRRSGARLGPDDGVVSEGGNILRLRSQLGRFAVGGAALVDSLRLRKASLRVKEWASLGESTVPWLAPAYRDYTSRVSDPTMAISFELAILLYGMCREIRPRRVADLGSGFSSYVLRAYAAQDDASARVVSVDDQRAWLEKTRAYLARHELPTEGLQTWSEFTRGDAGGESFDLVLHDLGSMETRIASLPRVLGWLAPGGLLVLDDFHKRAYRGPAAKLLRQSGFAVFSLRVWTLDPSGRFTGLAVRTPR